MPPVMKSVLVTAAAIAASILGAAPAVAVFRTGGDGRGLGTGQALARAGLARAGLGTGPALARGPASAAARHRVPVFAYYYLWMTGSYWSEHKLDHPVEPFPGNYRSDNPAVIRWQVRQARAAGLTGFIVSWKDTPAYRTILPLVERAARKSGLKLAMEYEGLNAARQPLPVATVAADFRFFTSTYAPNPAWYRIDGKPLTIWDGTRGSHGLRWPASRGACAARSSCSARGTTSPSSRRLAAYTDGDAYYWSSVYPGRDRFYASKLAAMGAAVHRAHKIWLAPFAPGFNATLIGGGRAVPRLSGATLRTEYATAARSAPDILGLISWNEWTENTYVEPSVTYG